jgi:hypothetical protein
MHVSTRLLLLNVALWYLLYALTTPVAAGMLGYPVPRLSPLHARFELAGDSFQETLNTPDNADAKTGRGLLTTVFGPTEWSEIYARLGAAEFSFPPIGFNGNFGFAYGGGVRFRLLRLPWGSVGLLGQYLRFQNDDNNNPNRNGTWEEVDVGLGLGSRRFGAFQFYGGGVYHNADIKIRNNSSGTQIHLMSDIPVRLFVGVNIYPLVDFPGGEFVVNMEARFVGEIPQVTLGLQYSF